MSYLLTVELTNPPDKSVKKGIHFALVNELNLMQIIDIIKYVDEFKKILTARKDDLIMSGLPSDSPTENPSDDA